MRIKIDELSLSKQGSTIFGNIHFIDEGFSFPESDWNDFILIILNWWSLELIKMLTDEKIKGEFSFMDGPYIVEVSYLSEDYFTAYFIKESDDLVRTSEILVSTFLKSFLFETNKLLRRIYHLGWDDNEVKELQNNLNQLREVHKNYNN